VPLSPEIAADLLTEAQGLNEEREYPALAGLLDRHGLEDLLVEPELVFLRADVFRRVGRSGEAIEALSALEPVTARRGNDRLHRRRVNLLGSLQFEAGDVDGARASWLRLLDDGARGGDEEFTARACNNLGVVATLRGDLPQALAHFSRALASYQRVSYDRGLGQSHHNLGIAYREMGFHAQADRHFRTASRLAREAHSEDELARVQQERSLLLYLLGDARLAQVAAGQALAGYERLDDPSGRSEVHRILGLIALGEGHLEEASRVLALALEGAVRAGARLLEAEVREARAALFRAVGDTRAGAEEEELGADLFTALGAVGWGHRTRDRARSLAARGGSRPT
jgi:tetratricopeptide (TPR) repeat protein